MKVGWCAKQETLSPGLVIVRTVWQIIHTRLWRLSKLLSEGKELICAASAKGRACALLSQRNPVGHKFPPETRQSRRTEVAQIRGESMNKHLNDAKSLSTLGVCRPITGGEHAPGCSVCTGRMTHRQRGDKAAFLQAQMKFTAVVIVQQMNIYWQKVLGLTYIRVNLKCYDNTPHSSILKNYKAISKIATPRTQSWQIKHFGSGQPFKFLQGQTHPGNY